MKQQGFGLLEILVVLGIIAILGAIAIPQYNEYMTRTRVTEALHHAQVYARKVQIEGATGGTTAENPPTLDHAKIQRSGSGINTKFTVTLKTSINSQALFGDPQLVCGTYMVLTQVKSTKSAQWACASNLPSEIMPKVCTFTTTVTEMPINGWVCDRDMDDSSLTPCLKGPVCPEADESCWTVGTSRGDCGRDGCRDTQDESIKDNADIGSLPEHHSTHGWSSNTDWVCVE